MDPTLLQEASGPAEFGAPELLTQKDPGCTESTRRMISIGESGDRVRPFAITVLSPFRVPERSQKVAPHRPHLQPRENWDTLESRQTISSDLLFMFHIVVAPLLG
jgi:hypothetical protein